MNSKKIIDAVNVPLFQHDFDFEINNDAKIQVSIKVLHINIVGKLQFSAEYDFDLKDISLRQRVVQKYYWNQWLEVTPVIIISNIIYCQRIL